MAAKTLYPCERRGAEIMTVITSNSLKLPDNLKNTNEPMSHIRKSQSAVDLFEMTKTPKFSISIQKSIEERFLSNLDLATYGVMAKNFIDTYMGFDNKQFSHRENLFIEPTDPERMTPRLKLTPFAHEQRELEEWHARHAYKFAEELLEADEHTRVRHHKREEKGLGLGGNLSNKTFAVKEMGHFAKDNLTIGGQVNRLTDTLCGESIYEKLPLYASRKGPKIGIVLSEVTLTSLLTAAGTALVPVSFGISQRITNQLSTIVTLSGEAIIGKVLGAQNKKIAIHAGLRGAQLEIPNVIPGGALVQLYETGMGLGSGMTIAASSIADIILRNISDRYASIISENDLGDERVLEAMDNRIDYLSRFLIPYGQYLLLRTEKPETKRKLLYIVKQQMKVLRELEKAKSKALNFYQLAILAERLPKSRLAGIEAACNAAVPNVHRNTHKMARRCLATLLRERPIMPSPVAV